MIVRGRENGRDSKMPCESCAVQFSVFKRKRVCSECERCYCSACLRRGGGIMCAPCRLLSARPLSRQSIAHLKVRDLQCFLQRQNVSTRGCVEKEELVSLCVSHVNSAAYRRRGSRGASSAFSSLKGLTTNINEFITSAFDLRPPAQPAHPAPPPPSQSCVNNTHIHGSSEGPPVPPRPPHTLFTTTPGGQRNITVPVPPPASVSRIASTESARVDTDDCFEIEDLDDHGWEVVHTPAEPLPNDSEVLISTPEGIATRYEPPQELPTVRHPEPSHPPQQSAASTPRRAASELDLRPRSPDSDENETISLHEPSVIEDEPNDFEPDSESPKHISLEQFKELSDLDTLSVRELKELLARNRVEYRGCVERTDLLERARTLWRNHQQYKDEIEKLPLEECCKICMAAPLECVLLECGHIAACTACAKQLAECPICRQYVVRAVRFFRS